MMSYGAILAKEACEHVTRLVGHVSLGIDQQLDPQGRFYESATIEPLIPCVTEIFGGNGALPN
jgi:hypothetical protein